MMNALPDKTARRGAQHDVGGLAERADALRRRHAGPRPLVLPNAWDVASARLVVKAGFPAVATSSGAVAATLGYEDNDSMPVDEAFGVIARITRSVPVPVTADVEAGYGLSPDDLVERLLNARVDVLRREGDRRELFEEAVRRARLYRRAGADCVFPIQLADEGLIGEFVRRAEGPVNIVGPGAPPLARLAELGAARVSFAGFLMSQLYGAHEARLSEIAAEVAAIA